MVKLRHPHKHNWKDQSSTDFFMQNHATLAIEVIQLNQSGVPNQQQNSTKQSHRGWLVAGSSGGLWCKKHLIRVQQISDQKSYNSLEMILYRTTHHLLLSGSSLKIIFHLRTLPNRFDPEDCPTLHASWARLGPSEGRGPDFKTLRPFPNWLGAGKG